MTKQKVESAIVFFVAKKYYTFKGYRYLMKSSKIGQANNDHWWLWSLGITKVVRTLNLIMSVIELNTSRLFV